MTVHAKLSENGQELTIVIDGRFDFSAHQEFRAAYEKLTSKPTRYVIDLAKANYLDSSALGMLLLLRDFAGGDNSQIALNNCNEDIKKILTISNFDQLFSIN